MSSYIKIDNGLIWIVNGKSINGENHEDIDLDIKNVELSVNLFYYNKDSGEMKYVEVVQISLNYVHASQYQIIIADKDLNAIPKTVDSYDIWRLVYLLVMGTIVMIIGCGIVYKKEQDEQ